MKKSNSGQFILFLILYKIEIVIKPCFKPGNVVTTFGVTELLRWTAYLLVKDDKAEYEQIMKQLRKKELKAYIYQKRFNTI